MPPPLPPPAEASVGMSAAALMAATVATAKIVLRIMGLSWFLLDVLSTSCLCVGRAIRRVQGHLDTNECRILGVGEAADKVACGGRFWSRRRGSAASRCHLACAEEPRSIASAFVTPCRAGAWSL